MEETSNEAVVGFGIISTIATDQSVPFGSSQGGALP